MGDEEGNGSVSTSGDTQGKRRGHEEGRARWQICTRYTEGCQGQGRGQAYEVRHTRRETGCQKKSSKSKDSAKENSKETSEKWQVQEMKLQLICVCVCVCVWILIRMNFVIHA